MVERKSEQHLPIFLYWPHLTYVMDSTSRIYFHFYEALSSCHSTIQAPRIKGCCSIRGGTLGGYVGGTGGPRVQGEAECRCAQPPPPSQETWADSPTERQKLLLHSRSPPPPELENTPL